MTRSRRNSEDARRDRGGGTLSGRRLSQAISEGDGISVIVAVDGPAAAREAEAGGAEGLLVVAAEASVLAAIKDATELPVIVVFEPGRSVPDGADACIVDVDDDDPERLESVLADLAHRFELAPRIRTAEHLEFVLEELDPEVLVLGSDGGDEPIAEALELLPDVPAGKLAIADVASTTRDEVVELERAGVDAVIVSARNVADLVGTAPPEV